VIIIVIGTLSIVLVWGVANFLSLHNHQGVGVVVVEGWLSLRQLKHAQRHIHDSSYDFVPTSGGSIRDW
tara:strand:- start:21325 stop:21531 length:207 start_codon:yes stop_codon:yes gene_type:complete